MNGNEAGHQDCGPQKVRLSGEAGLLAEDLEINRRAVVTLFYKEKGLEKSRRGGGDVSRPGETRWWLR